MLFDFATEELVPAGDARELTRPFWNDMTSVVQAGYASFAAMIEDHRSMLVETPFIPSVVIWGYIQSHAKKMFRGREHDGIVECTELGVFGFYVKDKLLVRFNVVDQNHIVRHTDSGTSRKNEYYRQLPIAGLNNRATRITVGAVPGAVKTELCSVVISCQQGDDLYFYFPIDGGEESVTAITTPTTPPVPGPIVTETPIQKRKPR